MNINKQALWKGVFESLFDDFLSYFYPKWTKDNVDFESPFQFSDAEATLIQSNPTQEEYPESKWILVGLKLKSGKEHHFFVYLEFLNDPHFYSERTHSFLAEFKKYDKKNVDGLAILVNDYPQSHPKLFGYTYRHADLVFRLRLFYLNPKSRIELEKDNNPFSIVMRVIKESLKKKNNSDRTILIWKTRLAKTLIDSKFDEIKTLILLDFIRYFVPFRCEEYALEYEQYIQTLFSGKNNQQIADKILGEMDRDVSFMQETDDTMV